MFLQQTWIISLPSPILGWIFFALATYGSVKIVLIIRFLFLVFLILRLKASKIAQIFATNDSLFFVV